MPVSAAHRDRGEGPPHAPDRDVKGRGCEGPPGMYRTRGNRGLPRMRSEAAFPSSIVITACCGRSALPRRTRRASPLPGVLPRPEHPDPIHGRPGLGPCRAAPRVGRPPSEPYRDPGVPPMKGRAVEPDHGTGPPASAAPGEARGLPAMSPSPQRNPRPIPTWAGSPGDSPPRSDPPGSWCPRVAPSRSPPRRSSGGSDA